MATKLIAESLDLTDAYNFTGTLQQNGASIGGDNTPSFFAYLNSDVNTNNQANVKLPCNVEVFDTDNKYDNTTNYRFTPTIAGKYLFLQTYILLLQMVISIMEHLKFIKMVLNLHIQEILI